MGREAFAARVGLFAVLSLGAAESSWAGAWVLDPGRVRIEAKLLHQDTRERYFLDGQRIPYFFEGHNRTSAAYGDVVVGLPWRLEAALQGSVFRIEFDDLADQRRSTGLGDTRLALRRNLLRGPLVITLGGRLKLPTGKFQNDAEVVPVGEGQYDYDFSLELGRSLWPRPGYLTGEVGYRFRSENRKTAVRPGHELFWSLEGGYSPRRRLTVKLLARGVHGRESTAFELPIATLRRKAVYVEPGLILDLGGGRGVSVSVPFTVSGRNWPAGPVLSVGVSQAF